MAELSINVLLYILLGILTLIIIATLFLYWKNGAFEMVHPLFKSASTVNMP